MRSFALALLLLAAVPLRELMPEQIEDVQATLKERGFYRGPIDGVAGPNTRRALEEFQAGEGLPRTGALDAETVERLGLEGIEVEERATPEPTPVNDRTHVRPRDDGK